MFEYVFRLKSIGQVGRCFFLSAPKVEALTSMLALLAIRNLRIFNP